MKPVSASPKVFGRRRSLNHCNPWPTGHRSSCNGGRAGSDSGSRASGTNDARIAFANGALVGAFEKSVLASGCGEAKHPVLSWDVSIGSTLS